jgi:superfamily II DNA/RNA helicase
MARSSAIYKIQLLIVMQSLFKPASSRFVPAAFRGASSSSSSSSRGSTSITTQLSRRRTISTANKRLPGTSQIRWIGGHQSLSSSSNTPSSYSSSSRLFSTDDATDGDGDNGVSSKEAARNNGFFAEETDFAALGVKSPVLLQRIEALGLSRPTSVQAAAFGEIASGWGNVTVGAETGSGKTLAYLAPLLDDILQRKAAAAEADDPGYDYARAVILVPNKELVQQVVRMAMPLSGGKQSLVYGGKSLSDPSLLLLSKGGGGGGGNDDEATVPERELIRIAILPGGLNDPLDFPPFRNSVGLGGKDPPVDLVISTPATIGPLGLKPKHIDMFADIQTLVIDEADMLLDGGYLRQLENVLMGFRRADRLQVDASLGAKKTQHVFVAATLPDMGLRSVDAYLEKKFPNANRITTAGMHNARHYGLGQTTLWIDQDSKKARMEQFVELCQQSPDEGGLKGEKVMVFLNSVDDVEGASQALNRAGMNSLPYHAKIKLGDRTETLERFRKYDRDAPEDDETVPILVCTDLASRGLDLPGVNTVVQLQFAGNVVSHLHRMGRCGRAGKQTGRGIVFFGEKERELVEVVRKAEMQQESMVLEGEVVESEEDGEDDQAGKVQKAFSRKRGFTKKLKKIRRDEREGGEPTYGYNGEESTYTGSNEQ